MDADDGTPEGCLPGPSPQWIAAALRAGSCPSDCAFDRLLPEDLRIISGDFWTPLPVAVRAAEWLGQFDVHRVVDIGSGAGKFCVATALAGQCDFVGLEHRPRLVAAARNLARRFSVEDRVRFVQGSLGEVLIPSADAYYLYNPFGENLFSPTEYLAPDVELSNARYVLDITMAQDLFRRARVGTCVLTYNGFGGRMPASYEQCGLDRELPCVLRMWRKTRPETDSAFSPQDGN